MVFVADKRIYVNRELTEIVPEDNPEGAILLVPEGGTLTDEDAARWGLSGTPADGDTTKPSPEEAFSHAQFSGTDTAADAAAGGKAVRVSNNKAISTPPNDKDISSADAPVPDNQMLPKDDVAPGS